MIFEILKVGRIKQQKSETTFRMSNFIGSINNVLFLKEGKVQFNR